MRRILAIGLPAIALLLLLVGAYEGLVEAPRERMMGDVYRLLYVHVPAAWITLVAYTVTFVASVVYLFGSRDGADALAEASAEVGVLLNVILLLTGSIWGRPTWGVWWTWDPRLTSAAIMFFAFVGYLALRRFVDAPQRRATWAAVVAIVVYVDIPIVWFSVKWWNSLHQIQSSPQTVASAMVLPLRINAFAFLFTYAALTYHRYHLARMQAESAIDEPPLEEQIMEKVS